MIKVSTTGMAVSLITDLRFPPPGQRGHGRRIIQYICKTKTSVSKVKICDIYYLEIMGHHIDVHTEHGTYQKYGTLNNELKRLSPYGFTKCTQSCIVSLHKIRTVLGNEIILTNHEHLYMSRHYAPNVLMAFSSNHKPI